MRLDTKEIGFQVEIIAVFTFVGGTFIPPTPPASSFVRAISHSNQ